LAINLLNTFPIPVTCISSPSVMTIICRFGLLMELGSSRIFLPQSFSLLSKNYSGFFILLLLSILSSSPETLSAPHCSVLVCILIVFFTWPKELFVSRVSVLLFLLFLKIFHTYVKFLLHILYCHLFFIYLFFKNNFLSIVLKFLKLFVHVVVAMSFLVFLLSWDSLSCFCKLL
jgi:hypothetical protein